MPPRKHRKARRPAAPREAAAACCRLGEFEVAAQWASQSLAIPHTNPYPELEANYTWLPHSLLYWSLFWLGRKDEARSHWETYLSLVPEDSMAREHARLFPPATAAACESSPHQPPRRERERAEC